MRFQERVDYLSAIKAINDADLAANAQRLELQLTMRRAIGTVPRHAAPPHAETCMLHPRKSPRSLPIDMLLIVLASRPRTGGWCSCHWPQ